MCVARRMADETTIFFVCLLAPAELANHLDGARLAEDLVGAGVLVAAGPGGVFAAFAAGGAVGVVTAGRGAGADALKAQTRGDGARGRGRCVGGCAAHAQARSDDKHENREQAPVQRVHSRWTAPVCGTGGG